MIKFRNAASLILAVRNGVKSNINHNFKILCLQRHKDSNHMPGAFVFPGGMIDPSDADLKWNNLFDSFGLGKNNFQSLFPTVDQNRPQIFEHHENELPREISLRISAIRETFEECGILICKQANDDNTPSGWAHYVSSKIEDTWAQGQMKFTSIIVPENEIEYWQQRVHNNPIEFYAMCEKFNCFPDLWALYEWANWVTPTFLMRQRRYNTVFFMAFLTEIPQTVMEVAEIEDIKWDTPENLISLIDEKLPPPQQYEIRRMAHSRDISDLLDRAVMSNREGVQANLPVRLKLLDGKVHVLPGDSFYPKYGSPIEETVSDKSHMTISELRDISKMKNRMEIDDETKSTRIFVHNFTSDSSKL